MDFKWFNPRESGLSIPVYHPVRFILLDLKLPTRGAAVELEPRPFFLSVSVCRESGELEGVNVESRWGYGNENKNKWVLKESFFPQNK